MTVSGTLAISRQAVNSRQNIIVSLFIVFLLRFHTVGSVISGMASYTTDSTESYFNIFLAAYRNNTRRTVKLPLQRIMTVVLTFPNGTFSGCK